MIRRRHPVHRKQSNSRKIFGMIYIIFGLYFLSFKLAALTIPQLMEGLNNWIIAIGGAFLILSGINFLLPKKKKIIY